LPERLDTDAQAVPFGQLLNRECGTEIRVVLPNQRQNRPSKSLAMRAIARTTAFAGS
jgi:hypothetical protein